MKFLRNSSTDPYFNMSLDEYCLEHYPCEETFFYLWRNSPAVIIGLNQNAYSEVNLDYLEAHDIKLARRVTGGGAVYHDLQNLNYSIVGKSVDAGIFASALRKLGLDAELTGRNDIFVDGRKVSGYARRVSKDREIIHGTLMYDVDIETLTQVLAVPGSKLESKGIASVRSRVANVKDFLPQYQSLDELQARLQELLAEGDSELPLSEAQISEVQRVAEEKFASWDWIYGRSRQADFTCRAKLACGTVQMAVSLDNGRIADMQISGDFIGSLPPQQLEQAVKGVKYDKDCLLSVLKESSLQSYLPGAREEEIIDLIFNQHI